MATTKTRYEDGLLCVETATGAAAIATTYSITNATRLISVAIKLSTAPTTHESLTITLDALAGSAYDVTLYTVDPARDSVTSLFWQPERELWLQPGDGVLVAYTNTDTRTYGLAITVLERY